MRPRRSISVTVHSGGAEAASTSASRWRSSDSRMAAATVPSAPNTGASIATRGTPVLVPANRSDMTGLPFVNTSASAASSTGSVATGSRLPAGRPELNSCWPDRFRTDMKLPRVRSRLCAWSWNASRSPPFNAREVATASSAADNPVSSRSTADETRWDVVSASCS